MTSRAPKAPTTTIVHRYPWSGEEKTILAFLTLVPVVVAGWRLGVADGGWVAPLVVAVIGWGAAAGLVVLGRRRKEASKVSAVLEGTTLKVTGGRVKRSRGDLSHAVSARTTRMGPETVLVVELTEGTVLVPGRIVDDPALHAVLEQHLVTADAYLDDDARQLLGV